ncbi:MAG: peroxiredoxin [Methylophilaceae bacterium]
MIVPLFHPFLRHQLIKLIALVILISLTFLGYQAFSVAANLPKTGEPAPNFSLPDAKSQQHQLSDYAGKWLVLYFYPKNDTPGCTKEACSFRDDLFAIEKLDAKVVGVSVDNTDSHAKFAEKYHLPFPLLADKDGKVADEYGALMNFGIIKIAKRYTFLIDPKGNIAKVYQSVDTSKHSQEIIADLTKLTAKP